MKTRTNPKVDGYIAMAKTWQAEIKKLRAIALDSGLTESMKWGHPCYTLESANIVLIHSFKEYCAYLFFKGALMKDAKNLLVQQTENVQSARQIRFTGVQDIVKNEATLKAYIREAMLVEKSGAQLVKKKTSEFAVPEEFQNKLDEIPELKTAFAALTSGRQRAYLLFFAGAKQSKTRKARIEKWMQPMLDGKGLDD